MAFLFGFDRLGSRRRRALTRASARRNVRSQVITGRRRGSGRRSRRRGLSLCGRRRHGDRGRRRTLKRNYGWRGRLRFLRTRCRTLATGFRARCRPCGAGGCGARWRTRVRHQPNRQCVGGPAEFRFFKGQRDLSNPSEQAGEVKENRQRKRYPDGGNRDAVVAAA